MSRASLYRIPLWLAVSLALAITPQVSLAQHGGHAGGGFHGGGGFGGFHNGGGFGGFHNGGGLGFHNGSGFGGVRNAPGFSTSAGRGFPGYYHPFYGGFRGAYGYHYGVSFNFGFAPYWGIYPYWGAYPYFYGYGPWWPNPYYPYYYYPYQSPYNYGARDDRCGPDCDIRGTDPCLPDYRHEDRCKDSDPATSDPKRESIPAQPSSTESSPNREYVRSNSEPDYRTSLNAVGWRSASTGNFEAAASTHGSAQIRPAVLNAIRALRAMPPAARLRRLKSDRYADFSPQERQLLEEASQPDLARGQ